MADFYHVNVEGDIKKKEVELLGPMFSSSNKSYIKSLLSYREAT